MKKFIFVLTLLVVAFITCPDRSSHIETIKITLVKEYYDDSRMNSSDPWINLGTSLGMSLMHSSISNKLEYNNYILFSVSKPNYCRLYIGVFNHVFMYDKCKDIKERRKEGEIYKEIEELKNKQKETEYWSEGWRKLESKINKKEIEGNEENIRKYNLLPQIWSIEEKYGYDLSKYPREVKDEYNELKSEIEKIEKRVGK